METEILQQRAANVLNVESSIVALSTEHANELFGKATRRLLNVKKWHTLPCSLLSELQLTDHNGFQVDRQVRENDYFVVNNDNGDGEWVKVERVFIQCDPSGPREVLTMRTRPTCSPLVGGEEPIRPSNTFKVMRQGLNITVAVYGKNDEDGSSRSYPSFEQDSDRPDLTVGAIPGVARVQWRSLVNGILSTWF
ncbi:MAG TPA: hypothetical protein VK589_08845 [Chryseolinea sp.]|nr:hypothetical protein [Chryseolinea sp.]